MRVGIWRLGRGVSPVLERNYKKLVENSTEKSLTPPCRSKKDAQHLIGKKAACRQTREH
jgi:hypothetical protein